MDASASALGGLDISAQLDRWKDSFLFAAARAGSEEEVANLIDMGADVNYTNVEHGECKYPRADLLA